ncbi:MAG: hypothetical protein HC848_03635, partial [Limnobacter sp.]|nr:hypothetical protein [Limnobacter sp.]
MPGNFPEEARFPEQATLCVPVTRLGVLGASGLWAMPVGMARLSPGLFGGTRSLLLFPVGGGEVSAVTMGSVQVQVNGKSLALFSLTHTVWGSVLRLAQGQVFWVSARLGPVYSQFRSAATEALTDLAHANNSTQLLRRQADVQSDFQRNVVEREADFNNRLIEIFGTPFPDDIGPAGTYPSGYSGPDLFHFSYVDGLEAAGITPPGSQPFTRTFSDFQVDPNGALNTNNTVSVT